MLSKDKKINKLYYSIGEVAAQFDVNASLIRFWEKEFSSIQPKKNKKGNRLFTQKDIEVIGRIYHLVKEKGYTLDGAKQALKSGETPANSSDQDEALIRRLEKIKNDLLTLKNEL